ncbi:acetylornithine/succinylornithine family transaminase [Ruminococcaceae bacterium OttesenSCG-928-A16]|nr:acetylornithine/succinylornithine family transaminase [Ruminococcaceae bacterium OttesenSCG-928-A16]
MNSQQIKQTDAEYILPTYARFNLCLVKGKGCTAQTPEGDTYLDFTSGIGVNSLGWCDDEWAAAVAAQAATLQHTSNLFYTEPATQLAQSLCQRTGMAKVFFGNSGAEANEAAIKAARKYSLDKYGEGRSTIITLQNSFHGRTMATLTATGQPSFHQHFGPFLPGFVYLPANDITALQAALTPGVCAVMFEPVQGEGGVVALTAEYQQALQSLCNTNDVLLIADEVQTGVGRTGTFLACEQAGITPDIVTLAKGLGSGLPIGAALFNQKCAGTLGSGTHGSTFGANPVCCAGANVVLNRLTPAFLAEVTQKANLLKTGLLALPGVASVTGLGLMLGVDFTNGLTAGAVQQAALQNGLLCLLAKNKLRLLPPLVITTEEIQTGLQILQKTLEGLQ